MTKAELMLAARMLRLASEDFSNNSCNDFDLVKEGQMTPEESLTFRLAAANWNGDDEAEEKPNSHWCADFFVMDFLAFRLEEEANKL